MAVTRGQTFVPMIRVIPEATIGHVAVDHFTVSEQESRFTALQGARGYVPAGRYARLKIHNHTVMSDTEYEHKTNHGVVSAARGSVLIAGLGLGMVLLPILRKREVRRVVVVEKEPNVIAIVESAIRNAVTTAQGSKLTVIHGDIFEWRPATGTKFTTVYFDIWADQSTDELQTMARLHRGFRKYVADGGWIDSWNREWLRYQRGVERRSGW